MAHFPADERDAPADPDAHDTPVGALVFNANDPSGAGGLAGDVAAITSVGGHAAPIVTGVYLRDTGAIFDHMALDDDLVAEQARTVLEDLPVQAIKAGFVGSADNLAAIAGIAADYPEVPLVAYMPDLSWQASDATEIYHDACTELLLPQASLLVGNHATLRRWLLPDWDAERAPTPRDLAAAAEARGVPYLLATGMARPDGRLDNVLASAHTVLCSMDFDILPGPFIGAGDTLSATVAALLASGCDLEDAVRDALTYLHGCLAYGFRPGMGRYLPDHMFWAEPEDPPEAGDTGPDTLDDLLDTGPHDIPH